MKRFWIMSTCMILIGLLLAGCAPAVTLQTPPTENSPTGTPAASGSPLVVAPPSNGDVVQLTDHPLYAMTYARTYDLDGAIGQDLPGAPQCAFACSVFAAKGNPGRQIFGRNFDWLDHPALLLFTAPPDGYSSVSMVDISYLGYDAQNTPLEDPTALRDAPFLPFDGMNEAGLAVGMMAIDSAEGGNDPQKQTVDELLLMRILLDRAKDVPSALELMRSYNVDFGNVPIHYLIADSTGNSAVVEYISGEPVVITNDLPFQVSTNFLISVENPDGASSSCPRYNHLYSNLEASGGVVDVAGGMKLLEEVSQGGTYATRWSVIYDLSARTGRLAMGGEYDTLFEFILSGAPMD